MTAKKKTPSKGKPRKAARKAPAKAAKKITKTAKKKAPPQHWLAHPKTIRKLWIGGGVALAALVTVEVGIPAHGNFGLDGTFAFNAWYGFAVCVAMIVAAKGLGAVLKRGDTYYDGD